MKKNIGILSVTYGNGERRNFIKKQIENIYNNSFIKKYVIIDNGSIQNDITSFILEHYKEKLIYYRFEENKGSAGGFKKGLEILLEENDVDYILLLDDDNIVDNKCLDVFISIYDKLSINNKVFFLQGNRISNLNQLSVGGFIVDNTKLKYTDFNNWFLGLNIRYLLKKFFLKFKKKNRTISKIIEIDFGMYGGLFFKKEILLLIGLPNEDFFVYVDDGEFTSRIRNFGGKIFLIYDAIIFDLGNNFVHGSKLPLNLGGTDKDDFRFYYSIRNIVYNNYKNKTNIYEYYFNKAIYLFFLFLIGILFLKIRRLKIILKAISDGEKGKLGKFL